MSKEHIVKVMMDFVYRNLVSDIDTKTDLENTFFKAADRNEAVKLIAFAMGFVGDLEELVKSKPETFLTKKQNELLVAIVERMSSLEFMFIPLVQIRESEPISLMPLLRVRKSPACFEYVDMAKRRYDHFQQFLESNKLPPGTLWYPQFGLLRHDDKGKLSVSSCIIKKPSVKILQNVAIVGNVAATVMAFTPMAPVATPLFLACNVPLIGFSIADLVDGCKYERNTVVVAHSAALVVNLVTFSSIGITTLCKVDRLRKLLSVKNMLLLDKAEKIMAGCAKVAAITNTVLAIGSASGWQNLDKPSWAMVTANLCFAFRKPFSEATAQLLFRGFQERGLAKFFSNICSNIKMEVLTTKIKGSWFESLLKIVFEFLHDSVQFTVDDDFTTLCVFGYKLEFQWLFQINGELMISLLQYLSRFQAPVVKLCHVAGDSFATEAMYALLELLKLVSGLPDVLCRLDEYIVLGKGHRFCLKTAWCWWNAPAHDRRDLLRALASLSESDTTDLNEIRSTRLGPDGDAALFRWLVGTGKNNYTGYICALRFLLEVAEHTEAQPITFDNQRIVVSPLFSISAEECPEYINLPVLLNNTEFLQLCKDVEDPQHPLLERAKPVWLRTIRKYSNTCMQLETVALLKKLFENPSSLAIRPPLLLADALNYALEDEEATVGTVYYNIMFAWHVLANEKHAKFNRAAMMARFSQLMCDAAELKMDQFSCLAVGRIEEPDEDKRLIAVARRFLPFLKFGPNFKETDQLYFGTKARAACWLHLMPALRNTAGREQFNGTLRYLLRKGDAKVLWNETINGCKMKQPRRVMFSSGNRKVLIELMNHHSEGTWIASVQLCSFSLATSDSIAKPIRRNC